VLAFVVLVALWQVATGTGLISPIFLPSPLRVVAALWDLAVSGDLWRHLSASPTRIGYGWLIGTLFGVGVGLTVGLFTVARAAGLPLVAAIFPIPKIALLPLLILWLGIGEGSKVATIALSVFFPTVIATFTGIDAVPRNLIRMAQSFNVPLPRGYAPSGSHQGTEGVCVGAACQPQNVCAWLRQDWQIWGQLGIRPFAPIT